MAKRSAAQPVPLDEAFDRWLADSQRAVSALTRRARIYGSSPIKRRARRTQSDIDLVEAAIYATLEAVHPQTVRGLFYQLVSQGVVPKTEASYKTDLLWSVAEQWGH